MDSAIKGARRLVSGPEPWREACEAQEQLTVEYSGAPAAGASRGH